MSVKGIEDPDAGLAQMLAWIDGLPGQIRDALAAADARGWPPPAPAPGAILFAGMGGSGMAGQLAASILQDRLRVPCRALADPEVPAWVGRETLVIVNSYSGETWEALAALSACRERGARVLLVTTGGALGREPEAAGAAIFPLPSGYAPRAALGWLLVPTILAAAGSEDGLRSEIRLELGAAAEELEGEIARWGQGGALPGRDPAGLAAEIDGRIAFVFAPSERLLPAAIRWKNQVEENGKQPAVALAFPEAAHNEVVGWSFLAGALPATFLVLDDAPSAAETRGRVIEAAVTEMERVGARVVRATGRGQTPAARLLGHVVLADRTSAELARRRGIDPVPIEAIRRMKRGFVV